MTTKLDAIRQREQAATPIPGLPGYAATESGDIWSTGTDWRGYGARRMVQDVGTDGYLSVRVLRAGRRSRLKVHALIARTFLGPRPAGEEVRHLNGNKSDNRVVNLAWGSGVDNAADRDRHGRTARGQANGWAVLTDAHIREIRRRYAVGGITQRELADEFGVDQSTISKVVLGKVWRHVAA